MSRVTVETVHEEDEQDDNNADAATTHTPNDTVNNNNNAASSNTTTQHTDDTGPQANTRPRCNHDPNMTFGPVPPRPKPPNMRRFMCQNINGLPTNALVQLSLFNKINECEPSCFSLAETKLDWSMCEQARLPTEKRLQRTWNGMKWTTSSSEDNMQKDHDCDLRKPGGIMQVTTSPMSSQVRSSTQDESGMGRWMVQMMHHEDGTKSAMHTVCRVCQDNALNSGDTTLAMQQWRMLRSNGM